MASLNSVHLIGNVGRDAAVRYLQDGTPVAEFTIAMTDKFGDVDNRQERTEWATIKCWRRQAEIAGQYVKKGRQVYVEGRLQTRDWVDPQGVKHWKTEVVAHRFLLLGNREQAVHGSEPDAFDVGELGPPFDAPELSPGI